MPLAAFEQFGIATSLCTKKVGRGWLAALAHELGHAYADVILNQHFKNGFSNAWA
jgi:hypothetical protein